MIRFAISLCLLLSAGAADELDEARDDLKTALDSLDRSTVNQACKRILKIESEERVSVFRESFRYSFKILQSLQKEREKLVREMEIHEVVRDKKGVIIKGDASKYFNLNRTLNLLDHKIRFHDGAAPHLADQIIQLDDLKAQIAAYKEAGEWYIRACCIDGIARSDAPLALETVLAAAKSEESPGVQVAIAHALGGWAPKSEPARKQLLAWIDRQPWYLRLASVQGLAKTGDRSLIWPIINMLVGAEGRMKYEINECLKKLTGVNKNGDFASWKEWWEKSRDAVLDGTYQPRVNERADVRGITTFYGIPIMSTALVFVIDNSSSMRDASVWKPEITDPKDKLDGDSNFDVARFELRRFVQQIADAARFNIVTIAGTVKPMKDSMVTADGSRQSAIKFIETMKIEGTTDVFGGVLKALEHGGGGWNGAPRENGIDTIFILSDGYSSAGVDNRDEVAERTFQACRYKKIAVNTVSLGGPKHSGQRMLQKIAEDTGGSHISR